MTKTDVEHQPAAGRWTVQQHAGDAASLHGQPLPEVVVPCAWILQATAPALVLGSSQSTDLVDAAAARRLGFQVAKRRSGGGAVLVVPGDVLWIDILLPAGDQLWDDDVGRAFGWLGEVWRRALADLGIETMLHAGAFERSAASDLVCFAGLGPGELTIDGAKVVGVSQRRTRAGARFQCAAVLAWNPEPLTAMLGLDDAIATQVANAGHALPATQAQVQAAFLNCLARY